MIKNLIVTEMRINVRRVRERAQRAIAVRPDQDNHQVLIIPKHLPVRVIVHRITRDLLLKVPVRVLPVQTEDRIF